MHSRGACPDCATRAWPERDKPPLRSSTRTHGSHRHWIGLRSVGWPDWLVHRPPQALTPCRTHKGLIARAVAFPDPYESGRYSVCHRAWGYECRAPAPGPCPTLRVGAQQSLGSSPACDGSFWPDRGSFLSPHPAFALKSRGFLRKFTPVLHTGDFPIPGPSAGSLGRHRRRRRRPERRPARAPRGGSADSVAAPP